MTNNNFKLKAILFSISLAIIVALGISYQVFALNPPTTQPPTGGGTIGIGSNAPSNSLYILSSGNVGIGTTAPGAKLEVAGQIKITGGSPGSGKVLTSDSSGLATWQTITGTLPSGSSGQTLRHNGTEWVANSLLYNNGTNVGIGTTTPGAKLDVVGGSIRTDTQLISTIGTGTAPLSVLSTTKVTNLNADLLDGYSYSSSWPNASNTITGSSTSSSYIPKFNGTYTITNSLIYDDGTNVGIGTTAPGAKLEVAGQIKITGGSPGSGKVLTSDSSGLATWQTITGTLPSGSSGQTLRHNGTEWVANSLLYNNGTNVGIGTTTPGATLDVQGAAQFGTGNVNLIDSTGKIPAISSTYFASLSGANLTSLNASNLSSGTVPSARISGSYTGITGVGTLTTGTWNATAIADAYIASAATWNAKLTNPMTTAGDIIYGGTGGAATRLAGAAGFLKSTGAAAPSWSTDGSSLTSLNASSLSSGTVPSARISGSYTGITGVGTLTTGTWNASSISTSYTAAKDTTNDSWTGTSNVYTTSGNVGIGTTGPTQKLQVNGAIGAYSDADSWIVLYPGGDVTAIMWDNATSPGGGLQFSTWDTFNSGNYSAKAIITNAGNVGIGTTAPAQKLDVNGTGRFSDTIYLPGTGTNNISPGTGDGATYSTYNFALRGWYGMAFKDYSNTVHGVYNFRTGSLTIDGSVTAAAFYYSSDESLKTNIKPLESGLQKILNLEPVYFDYKENNKHSLGFIAQDVEKQFPELVTTDSLTGLKSLDYSRLTAPLVGAIKEQQEQINSLTQKIESQQEQIEELKNLLK